jgi:hypothetical protein
MATADPVSSKKRRRNLRAFLPKRFKQEAPPYWARPKVFVPVLAVLFVFWLLPTLVGHTPLVSWIASRAAADVNGRIEVQSASLGWFSPIRLYGLKIVDQEGRPVVEVPEVHGDRALTAMIWNAANVGRFRLEGPKFTVVVRDNGSNVEEVFAKYLAPREKKNIDVAVEIVDGSISIEDARSQRAWQIDKFNLDLALPADRSRPLELKTSGLLAGSQRGGSFDLAMRVQQVQRDGDAAVAVGSGLNESGGGDAGASGPDSISLKAEGISLAVLDPFIRRAAPGLRMAGRLSAAVEGRWDSRRPDSRATLQTSVVAEELKLAGPMFGSDQPSLARFRVDGAMAWQNGVVQFDRVTTESELGSLSLSGTVAPSGARAAVRQGYEVNGQLDLVRLAAILPDTLRIQKNTQIKSGQVQLAFSGKPGQEGMAWKGKLEISNLTANNGGRSVVWQQPVTLTVAAKETAQGPVIETLKCDSSFLKVHAAGTPSQLTGNATFDASKLSEQLRGFVDLAGTRLAGDGWAELNWKRSADGAFDAGAKFRLNGFQWAVPDRPAWTEDALTITLSATGRADSTRNRIDTAVVKLESDRDLVAVRLVEPVADFRRGSPISLEVHSQGLLTRWPGRLALWFPSKNWTAGGSFDLVTGATISETGIALRQFRFTADRLELAGPELAVREPKAELTLAGRWDGKTRRLELESAGLSCATLEAKANRFVCAIPPHGPVELSGTVTYQAALDRIRGWTAVDPKKPPSWRMAGRLGGKAEFQQSGGLITGRVDGQVTDLEIAHSSGQRYQEREVRFVGQGNYNDVSRLVHIEQAELTSATVRCALAGKIVNVGSQPDLQLAGRIDYDMDRLSQFIRSMAGDGVRLGGRGSSTISHQGVWGSDAAVASGKLGWTWAQLYGFQLGAGELQASLSKGVFEVRPLDLECSEGRLRVAPQFKIAQEPREITLNAGRVVDRVRISPEMCKTLLQYMAPLLAGVTSAEGRFSIDLEGFRLPLAGQSKLAGASSPSAVKWSEAEIAGKLVIHSAQVGPGYLIQELAKLFGRTTPAYLIQESTIPFRMTKGRIYHQQMDLVFNEVKLRTYGSVGLDQSLAMMIEMPIPPKWQTGKILGPALKDQIIKLPIGGYLGQPKIDRTAFDQIARQFFQNATQNVIKNRLGELLGPLPKR